MGLRFNTEVFVCKLNIDGLLLAFERYGDYNASSVQYKWLAADLKAVDRSKTPWLVVSMHAPWYNSNVKYGCMLFLETRGHCWGLKYKYLATVIGNAKYYIAKYFSLQHLSSLGNASRSLIILITTNTDHHITSHHILGITTRCRRLG